MMDKKQLEKPKRMGYTGLKIFQQGRVYDEWNKRKEKY
jgi:hypothetical protein